MSKRAVLLVLATLALAAPFASPAGAYGSGSRSDSDSACASVLGALTANCASLTISATTGSCTSENFGTREETLVCTDGTYSVSGTLSGWLTPGRMVLSAGSGCSPEFYVDYSVTGYEALKPFGPYEFTCDGFTVEYDYCRQAAAGASMTFVEGQFRPRSLYVVASINQVSDGCVPNHP